MKIVFMGTPDFAVDVLEALLASPHEVTAVVTQPDKQKGRGKEVQYPPVKECALAHGIPVFQPIRIKSPEAVAELRTMEADIFVAAAFGQILSKEILEMPPQGCICVHASLLPKYRGAAPIQWAIIEGEQETGVTIMRMDEGIDTGDMILKTVVPITAEETGDSLHNKLAAAGAALCTDVLDMLEHGEVHATVQDGAAATYAKMLTKEMGHIRFAKSAAEIERLIRGLNSWPSAYTYLNGKTFKIWQAEVVNGEATGEPGTVAAVTKNTIIVNTGKGQLSLAEVQLEGKKRMDTACFLLGYPVTTDTVFEA